MILQEECLSPRAASQNDESDFTNGKSIRRKYLRGQTNSFIYSLGSMTQIYKLLNIHSRHLSNPNVSVQVLELLCFAIMAIHMLKLFSLQCVILLRVVLRNKIHQRREVK